MTAKPIIFTSLLLLAMPLLTSADDLPPAESIKLCPVPEDSPYSYSPPPVFEEGNREQTRLSAEQVKNIDNSNALFSGDVLIERHLLRLRADKVLHNNETQQLDLTGNVHADTENMSLNATSGWLDLESNAGELMEGKFTLQDSQLSGQSPKFSITNDKRTILIDGQFSSCPEQQLDWHLNTSWMELDHEEQTGTAKHTVFWIKDIPVLYLPWVQFPLGDERRSGFLMPSFGTSSSRGFEFNQPWYWNIAPNQDATFTPRYLRKRGSMLNTDYRFLSTNSKGDINIEHLRNDRLLNQERYMLHLDSQSKLTDNLKLNLLANKASDNDYLKDLGSNIDIANQTHLKRQAKLNYQQDNWNATLQAQAYQTIDDTININNYPYRHVPQVTLMGNESLYESHNLSINASLDSEWVNFEHESGEQEQGNRFHLYPRLSLPLQGNAWFFKPTAGMMHTRYDITDGSNEEIEIEERNLSVFSIDSGLFFERSVNDSELIQTLEPRIFYLNIPYEDQSNIPLFDTSAQSYSFSSLFSENRFNGIDRIGDANQVSLALTTRLLNNTDGSELLHFSLGRIVYFDDQQVSLSDTVNTEDASDIISEIGSTYQSWKAKATVQWDTETDKSDKRNFLLSYAPDNDTVFNLGYRFSRDPIDENENLEQSDVSFAMPITGKYSLMSRWNYSITEERDINTLVGIGYESCCWSMRLVSQRYLTDDTNEPYDTSVMFQFILKGFGSISDKSATSTLKNAILGYQPDY